MDKTVMLHYLAKNNNGNCVGSSVAQLMCLNKAEDLKGLDVVTTTG
jgi:hypothetical protein